jgi:hypothetical protein
MSATTAPKSRGPTLSSKNPIMGSKGSFIKVIAVKNRFLLFETAI